GPIIDGFDDWLAASGYTPGSREFAIRMLPHVDADLRHHRARHIASLTPAMLHASWRALIKTFPTNAGTVRSLARSRDHRNNRFGGKGKRGKVRLGGPERGVCETPA